MREIKHIRKDYNEELKQQNEILKKDAMSLGTMELKKNVWNNQKFQNKVPINRLEKII